MESTFLGKYLGSAWGVFGEQLGSNLKASPMPPAPWLAVCSKAANSSITIWYRVCTKHGTRSGNLSSSRFGIRSGTRSVLFRMPADVRDLIAGLVPAERRPDLVHDLGQDLSGRSGSRTD